MSNERIIENSNQIIANFGNKIKKYNEQLNTIENVKLKNQVSLYEYVSFVDDLNGANECWGRAYNQALNDLAEGGILYCTGRTYNFQTTINYSVNVKIVGIKNKTIFKCNKSNIVFFNMVDNSNVGIIENISFEGLGSTFEQTGIDINSWNTKIKDCTIKNFNKGIDCKGVLIDIDNCYIMRNNIGVEINQLKMDLFSTMIKFKKCLIHYNTLGVKADDKNNVNKYRPCVGLYVDECAFENNTQAFYLKGIMNGIIENSWFEKNINRPQTNPSDITLVNNKYEYSNGVDQTIEFLTGETYSYGKYGGYNECRGGIYSARYFELQEYESSDMAITNKKQLALKSGLLNCDDKYVVTTDDKQNKHYSIVLNKKGIVSTNINKDLLEFTNQGVGKYKVKLLNDLSFSNPCITVTFANDDGGSQISGVTRFNFRDLATYLNYNAIDRIETLTKNIETSDYADCKVMVSIWCDDIK